MAIPEWVHGLKRPLLVGLAAAVVTAVMTLFMPNYYKSEARILPVESKSMGGNLGGLAAAAAAFGVNVPGGEGSDANFVDILNSRTLREKLLETEFSFKERAWYFGKEQPRTMGLAEYFKASNRDRGVAALRNVIGVSRDIKSKVITVTSETRSPELSQLLVKRSLEFLEAFVQEKGRTRGGAKASFAEKRLQDARVELAQVEAEYRGFLEGNRNYLVSADPGVRVRGMRLEGELKLRQQLVMTIAMSREQALMEEKNDIPILNVLDSASQPIEKTRPSRSSLVFSVFILSFICGLGWDRRDWIENRLRDGLG